MSNLALLIVVIYCYTYYFWSVLFLAVSIFRFKTNKSIPIFLVSLLFASIFFYLRYIPEEILIVDHFTFAISIQVLISIISHIYNFRKGYWKNDVVFLMLEPILMVIVSRYLIFGGFDPTVVYKLENWLTVYIYLQSAVVLAKIVIAYQTSSITHSAILKIKFILYNLPFINTSIGLNDMALLGVGNIVHPTNEDIFEKEVEFMKDKILHQLDDNLPNLKSVEREQKRYEKKYMKKTG